MEWRIDIAQAHEIEAVLALIEALLSELGDEGQEFARIDRARLTEGLEREMAAAVNTRADSPPVLGRFLALLAREESGIPVGVLTLSASFAVYAGGEYGVIDEMYVRPEYRSRGIGRALLEAAVDIAKQREWFRLDVTGPLAATRGAPGPADSRAGGGSPRDAGSQSDTALADPALGFYLRLGFEPTGQKLRLPV